MANGSIGRSNAVVSRLGRQRSPRARVFASGVLVAVACLFGALPASGTTSTVTTISSANSYYGVSDDGTSIWASTDESCTTSGTASTTTFNYVFQFSLAGTLQHTYTLAGANCNPSLVQSNGTYAVATDNSTFYVINIASNAMTSYAEPSGWSNQSPVGLAVDSNYLYLSNGSTGQVDAFNFAGTLAWSFATSSDCAQALNLSSNGTDVWVGCNSPTSLFELNAGTGAFVSSIALTHMPNDVVVYGSHVWVTDNAGSALHEFSESPLALVGSVTVTSVEHVAVNGSNAWVTSFSGQSVVQVDIATMSLVTTYSTGSYMLGVAADSSNVWATGDNGPLFEIANASAPAPTTTTISLPGGATSGTVGVATTITATLSVPGTVTFFDGGAAIGGCSAVSASTTATCSWTPSSAGSNALSATLTPSSASYANSTSATDTISVAPAPATITIRSFSSDSTNLPSHARSELSVVARRIFTSDVHVVVVTGFSDAQGSSSLNASLSRHRAMNVVASLRADLARDRGYHVRFIVHWEGSKSPAGSNATAFGRSLNRRVVISWR